MPPINTRLRERPEFPEHHEPVAISSGLDKPPASFPSGGVVSIISPVLRFPLPNLSPPSADNLRQYYAGGMVPQYRFSPPTAIYAGFQQSATSSSFTSISGTLTTSASDSDVVNLSGFTANSQVSLTPTNAVAAAMTGVYISNKTAGRFTVNHPATSGGTFDIIVS